MAQAIEEEMAEVSGLIILAEHRNNQNSRPGKCAGLDAPSSPACAAWALAITGATDAYWCIESK